MHPQHGLGRRLCRCRRRSHPLLRKADAIIVVAPVAHSRSRRPWWRQHGHHAISAPRLVHGALWPCRQRRAYAAVGMRGSTGPLESSAHLFPLPPFTGDRVMERRRVKAAHMESVGSSRDFGLRCRRRLRSWPRWQHRGHVFVILGRGRIGIGRAIERRPFVVQSALPLRCTPSLCSLRWF